MKKMTINLHFTDCCNFVCHHCFVKKQGKELSLDNIKIIIDKIAVYANKNKLNIRINLAGGEPLISKNIQAIIDYIYTKGLEVSVITNGFYLTKELIEQNKTKISMIGISVDSLIPQTNLAIGRCTKSHAVLTEQELIEKCSFIKMNGIKLKINICVSSLNKDENFKEFLGMVGPNRIKMLRVLGENKKASEPYLISDEEWERIKQDYQDINPVFEDNDYMRDGYIIIDSTGNLSKNNLHVTNNSVIDDDFETCLDNLSKAKEVSMV